MSCSDDGDDGDDGGDGDDGIDGDNGDEWKVEFRAENEEDNSGDFTGG